MSRDPFERMRRNNPVRPDQAPSPPMSVADRILGARSTRPGWVIAVAAAAVVVVVGGGTLLLVNGTDSTVVAEATTSSAVAPSTSGAGVTAVTPTTGYSTTTLGSGDGFPSIVYFFADGIEDTAGSGPYLVPLARGAIDRDVAAGTLQALLEGAPTDTPALSTAIPEGLVLQSVDVVDGGIAEVVFSDSRAFFDVAESDPVAMHRRVAQVVYSLTGIDGIDGVRFGRQAENPAALLYVYPRRDFDDLLPAIMIETPAYGGFTRSPLVVSGTADVFEASVSLALTDGDGSIIWEGFTTATCGTGCRGDWSIEIPFEVDEPQLGSLIAWEESARDGSRVNIREHPVWLVQDEFAVATTTTSIVGSVPSCSGNLVTDGLVDQPELPEAVAAIRAAIFDAARACDWEVLRSLTAADFTFSFGGPGDPIAYWQSLEESRADEPMRFLAEILNRPFRDMGDGEYAWPSAFGIPWDVTSVTTPGAEYLAAEDIEALRPLYEDEDFVAFAEFGGYLGYRAGVTDAGWVFFVGGD